MCAHTQDDWRERLGMHPRRFPELAVIGVPMELGGGLPGSDLGPRAIRCAGLVQRLRRLGYAVQDGPDLARLSAAAEASVDRKRLKHLNEVLQVNRELCVRVAGETAAGRFPLVLGGDHSIAVGTLAGLSRQVRPLGVIWFDAHTDVNTAGTTPSGNIHGMSLAAALGCGHKDLTAIGGTGASVRPEHAVIVGARSIDPGERDFLRRRGVAVFTMREIDRLGIREVTERAIAIAGAGTAGFHLSFDLDVLEPQEAPGVGTPVPGGLSLREGLLAMELLSEAEGLAGAEFVEVNPLLDCRNRTAETASRLIGALFGERAAE